MQDRLLSNRVICIRLCVALGTTFALGGAAAHAQWVEQQKLTASDTAAFGRSVSVSGDIAIVGAYAEDCAAGGTCGAVYVYRFNGTAWVEEQKLTASDAAAGDRFGFSVAVSGDTALVGADLDGCAGGTNCGAAYIYRFDGNSWVQEQKLTASDSAGGDVFGTSVSVSGDTSLVGAPGDDNSAGFNRGAAYVYRFDGSTWVQEAKLIASDATGGDDFARSLSLSGDTALLGAPAHDCVPDFNCGAAYVFRFNGTSWVEEQKLTASDTANGDEFGYSVSLSGDTSLVGAWTDDCAAGINCGAAYVHRFDGTTWVQESKLTASDGGVGDFFGVSVSLSGDTALVGAGGDDCPAGSFCGAAYVFSSCLIASPAVGVLPDAGFGRATRRLSLQAGDAGRSQAIRVTFDDLAGDYAIWNGTQMWVQAPEERCEHASTVSPPCPGGVSYQAATLGCNPHYMDWSTVSTVHVHHEGVIPRSSYTIEVIDEACAVNDPNSYSAALPMDTSKLGDCCGLDVDDPPNGGAALPDVIAILRKFANDPSAPIKARVDHAGASSVELVDHVVGLSDVLAPLQGFANLPYPGIPSVPNPCP